jgi:hypothetical protein
MAETKRIKNKKTVPKKTITAYAVIRVIMIVLVCLILLLGIVGRITHYFNIHFK